MLYSLFNIIRKLLVGKKQVFSFRKVDTEAFMLPNLTKTDIYIHIPFCKSMCQYCPYNRFLYDKAKIAEYMNSLSKEIEIYSNIYKNIEINSVYIGGGTPTNALDELAEIINTIKEKFIITGDIAIETTVADINDDTIIKLKALDISMVSLGVQSFNDKYLKLLGRNYLSKDISPAIGMLKSAGFKTVNTDLIFAFPGQTKKELLDDLKKVLELEPDQITLYPLFTFPYSSIGEFLKINKVKMPGIIQRRQFYRIINKFFTSNSYSMNSVWSFCKGEHKYSSVTRENYIGFGAGAGSKYKNLFYFNTFSVSAYNSRLANDVLPVAVSMPISKELSNYYNLYWKLYNARFEKNEIIGYHDCKINLLLKIFRLLKLCKFQNNMVILTERGSFWIHLAQNYFLLNYINKVWGKMKQIPFPEKINF